MAPVILGFVIQALRNEERRNRLLLATSLTPRQLAWVSALIPVIMYAIGILLAALMLALEALITGSLARESMHLVAFVGGMIFTGTLVGLLIQEAVAAHRQGRSRAAIAGWAVFGVVALVFASLQTASVVFQGPATWPLLHLGNLTLAAAALAATVGLAAGRSDFTS
jgi:hypothetical protein